MPGKRRTTGAASAEGGQPSAPKRTKRHVVRVTSVAAATTPLVAVPIAAPAPGGTVSAAPHAAVARSRALPSLLALDRHTALLTLSFLSPRALACCCAVSQRWRLPFHNALWLAHLRADFAGDAAAASAPADTAVAAAAEQVWRAACSRPYADALADRAAVLSWATARDAQDSDFAIGSGMPWYMRRALLANARVTAADQRLRTRLQELDRPAFVFIPSAPAAASLPDAVSTSAFASASASTDPPPTATPTAAATPAAAAVAPGATPHVYHAAYGLHARNGVYLIPFGADASAAIDAYTRRGGATEFALCRVPTASPAAPITVRHHKLAVVLAQLYPEPHHRPPPSAWVTVGLAGTTHAHDVPLRVFCEALLRGTEYAAPCFGADWIAPNTPADRAQALRASYGVRPLVDRTAPISAYFALPRDFEGDYDFAELPELVGWVGRQWLPTHAVPPEQRARFRAAAAAAERGADATRGRSTRRVAARLRRPEPRGATDGATPMRAPELPGSVDDTDTTPVAFEPFVFLAHVTVVQPPSPPPVGSAPRRARATARSSEDDDADPSASENDEQYFAGPRPRDSRLMAARRVRHSVRAALGRAPHVRARHVYDADPMLCTMDWRVPLPPHIRKRTNALAATTTATTAVATAAGGDRLAVGGKALDANTRADHSDDESTVAAGEAGGRSGSDCDGDVEARGADTDSDVEGLRTWEFGGLWNQTSEASEPEPGRSRRAVRRDRKRLCDALASHLLPASALARSGGDGDERFSAFLSAVSRQHRRWERLHGARPAAAGPPPLALDPYFIGPADATSVAVDADADAAAFDRYIAASAVAGAAALGLAAPPTPVKAAVARKPRLSAADRASLADEYVSLLVDHSLRAACRELRAGEPVVVRWNAEAQYPAYYNAGGRWSINRQCVTVYDPQRSTILVARHPSHTEF